MKNIAIIPARSGSKGLKNKNIKLLNGKPLMTYAIEAAIKSKKFETVVVSTDSDEYAKIAIEYGAEVPFIRRRETATDGASSWDVVKEVLEELEKTKKKYDNVMLLQPTSPLRTYDNINAAFEIMKEKKAMAIISVCEMEQSPLWCNKLPKTLCMSQFIKPEVAVPRQMLDKYYLINGAIYLVNINYLCKESSIFTEKSFAYIMNRQQSVDIDNQEDFELAEYFMKIRKD